ncbi:MAG: ADP-ribosylation factor-like protein [bacterium]
MSLFSKRNFSVNVNNIKKNITVFCFPTPNLCRFYFFAFNVGISILIFANKQDLEHALSAQAIADVLDLKSDRFYGHHFMIHSCSAITGDGLESGINWMVDDIANRIFMLS